MIKPDGKLAVAVGVDVLGMTALQHFIAGVLPAVGRQRDAERAGVPMGHPGPLSTVPGGIAQGGVRPGTLDQTADAVRQVGGVLVLGGVHHAGHLVVTGGLGRLCRGHQSTLCLGQGIVHLAGQLRTALTVLCHKAVGVGDQVRRVCGAVPVDVFPHELPGFLVQPGQAGDVLIPRFR